MLPKPDPWLSKQNHRHVTRTDNGKEAAARVVVQEIELLTLRVGHTGTEDPAAAASYSFRRVRKVHQQLSVQEYIYTLKANVTARLSGIDDTPFRVRSLFAHPIIHPNRFPCTTPPSPIWSSPLHSLYGKNTVRWWREGGHYFVAACENNFPQFRQTKRTVFRSSKCSGNAIDAAMSIGTRKHTTGCSGSIQKNTMISPAARPKNAFSPEYVHVRIVSTSSELQLGHFGASIVSISTSCSYMGRSRCNGGTLMKLHAAGKSPIFLANP